LASDELKALAAAMRASETMSADLRRRFIAVRTALFQRGIFDPVLVRFDTITVARASTKELADQLVTVSDGPSLLR
jgi:hypothetical protein